MSRRDQLPNECKSSHQAASHRMALLNVGSRMPIQDRSFPCQTIQKLTQCDYVGPEHNCPSTASLKNYVFHETRCAEAVRKRNLRNFGISSLGRYPLERGGICLSHGLMNIVHEKTRENRRHETFQRECAINVTSGSSIQPTYFEKRMMMKGIHIGNEVAA